MFSGLVLAAPGFFASARPREPSSGYSVDAWPAQAVLPALSIERRRVMADVASSQGRFVRAAMKAPYLARDEERRLAIRWKETHDQQALHRLTSAHMRLVIAIAARF